MNLDLVQIQHLRNLGAVSLTPSPTLNFFFGQNGSGKSSLLEAIYYLGYARSFRTNKHKNVIQNEQGAFNVFCKISNTDGSKPTLNIGLKRSRDDSFVASINGNHTQKVSDLVSELPVQLFTPQSSDLILGSPSQRRKFVDWGLFHVEQSFKSVSQHYSKLVKHKNAMLKRSASGHHQLSQNDIDETQYWNTNLALYGEKIDALRQSFISAIRERFISNLSELLPEFSVEISYYRGWEKGLSLLEAINAKSEKDSKFGFVSVGPHKADLKIKVDNIDAAEVLSRGQLRMLVAALQLAQINCLNEQAKKQCVFLLDDVGAELDVQKRELFIDKILENNAQLFVTAIEPEQIPFINKYQDKKMFHVEHGHVTEES